MSDEMALATPDDVVRRLEEEPTERMLDMIEEALLDASDLARHYGDPDWTHTSAPARVKRIVAAATARWIRNPDSFTTSRAADETLSWNEVDEPGSIKFTAAEIEQLRRAAPVRVAGFGSFGVSAWGDGSVRMDEYVPWQGSEKPFPFIAYNDPLRRWRR